MSDDKKPEKTLIEQGLQKAGDATTKKVTGAATSALESLVPAPARKLFDLFTKEDPKAASAAAPDAAASTPSLGSQVLDTAGGLLKKGEQAVNVLDAAVTGAIKDGKAAVGAAVDSAATALTKPAAPAVAAPAVAAPASSASTQAVPAPKSEPTPRVKAEIKKIADVVETMLPAKVAPAAAPAAAEEPAPDTKKSEFNPKFKKPDAKGEVVITKKSDGGVQVETSTESVYERALKAMKAADKADGKTRTYEALGAAIEVAAQNTPNKPVAKGPAK